MGRGGVDNVYIELFRENFKNLPVPSHKAIKHVALSFGPVPRLPKLWP